MTSNRREKQLEMLWLSGCLCVETKYLMDDLQHVDWKVVDNSAEERRIYIGDVERLLSENLKCLSQLEETAMKTWFCKLLEQTKKLLEIVSKHLYLKEGEYVYRSPPQRQANASNRYSPTGHLRNNSFSR